MFLFEKEKKHVPKEMDVQRRRERRERRKPKTLFCVTVKCRQIARFYFLLLV